jgi:predicted DNA binding CopG/RHH family protein
MIKVLYDKNKKIKKRRCKIMDERLEIAKKILQENAETGESFVKLCQKYNFSRNIFYDLRVKAEEDLKNEGMIEEQTNISNFTEETSNSEKQGINESIKTSKPNKQVFDKSKGVKKTFKLYEQVEKAIKIEAAKQGLKVVDFVNKALWQAISDEVKKILG